MHLLIIGLDIAKSTGWAAQVYNDETQELSDPRGGTELIRTQLELFELLRTIDLIFDDSTQYVIEGIVVVCPLPTRFYDNMAKQFKMLGVIELWAENMTNSGLDTYVIQKTDNAMRKAVLGILKYPDECTNKKDRRAYRKKIVMDRYKDCAETEDEADALMFVEYYYNYLKENDTERTSP